MWLKVWAVRLKAGRLQHRDFAAHLGQQGHEVLRRVVLGVQQHVEQRELDLAQRLHAALEVLGGEHLVEQRRAGSGSPVSTWAVMWRSTSHSQQKFSMNWLGSSTASHSTPPMPDTSRRSPASACGAGRGRTRGTG
jgi:hypothetical protein